MPIVMQRNNTDTAVVTGGYNHDHDDRIRRPGFVGSKMTCISIYGSTGNGTISPEGSAGDLSEVVEDDSTSSTSSIGKNSDDVSSPERCSDGEDHEEVQSEYKGGALDCLEALEEVLPMKRSISQFYAGKSKSFTSLDEAVSCSSIKEIVKPENAYTRRRKNLLAFRNIWDKNHNGIRRSNSSGGISKRHSNSRSNLALAATMGCGESSNSSDNSNSNSNSPSLGTCLPPLPPQVRRFACNDLSSPRLQQKPSSWRSFSLSDLQGVAAIQSASGHNEE